MEEQQQEQQHSPYASQGSPYPLLTTWYYGRLYKEYDARVIDLFHQDPTLSLLRTRKLVAAQLVVELDDERTALEAQVKQIVREHRNPNYMDDFIEFYDRLLFLKSYRQELQDLSGTRTMLLDEQDYREQRGY